MADWLDPQFAVARRYPQNRVLNSGVEFGPLHGDVAMAVRPSLRLQRLPIMYLSILAVGIGGALGSLLRWVLGLRLNALFPSLPLGTLASNIIAGYIIGVALAAFARLPDVSPQWRLFVITGCMGGLSTFSTFSAEVVAHLQNGRLGWAAGEIAIHVCASVLMTILGIATVAAVMR
jgi:fluoride exporter